MNVQRKCNMDSYYGLILVIDLMIFLAICSVLIWIAEKILKHYINKLRRKKGLKPIKHFF